MPSPTRDALLEVTGQLLDEGGPEAVTLREVGLRAGVSHNAPYKHFPSKQALLAAFAARELSSYTRATTELRGTGPAAEALRGFLHHYLAWAAAHPARYRLVFGGWTVDSAELAEAAHQAHAGLVGLVVAAQSAGAVPAGDPERLAALLRSAAHGAAELAAAGHLARDGKGRADPEDVADDLLGYLRAAAAGGRAGAEPA